MIWLKPRFPSSGESSELDQDGWWDLVSARFQGAIIRLWRIPLDWLTKNFWEVYFGRRVSRSRLNQKRHDHYWSFVPSQEHWIINAFDIRDHLIPIHFGMFEPEAPTTKWTQNELIEAPCPERFFEGLPRRNDPIVSGDCSASASKGTGEGRPVGPGWARVQTGTYVVKYSNRARMFDPLPHV